MFEICGRTREINSCEPKLPTPEHEHGGIEVCEISRTLNQYLISIFYGWFIPCSKYISARLSTSDGNIRNSDCTNLRCWCIVYFWWTSVTGSAIGYCIALEFSNIMTSSIYGGHDHYTKELMSSYLPKQIVVVVGNG